MQSTTWFLGETRPKSLRRRSIGLTTAVAIAWLLQMLALPLAGAAPGDLTLASTSSGGAKGNDSSEQASLSADGTKVAFHTLATNLDLGDNDAFEDVYVKDLVTGTLTLASTSSLGVKGNHFSAYPSLSADGTKVAFYSLAWNLVADDTNSFEDVFVKDLVTGTITLASSTMGGTQGNWISNFPSLSANGDHVAFQSVSDNLVPDDTNNNTDVFVKDLTSGHLHLASTSSDATKALGHSVRPSLSADGTKVAFNSSAWNLHSDDTDTVDDVFVKDLIDGHLFLATKSSSGLTKADNASEDASLSADGLKVAFYSLATNIHPDDTDTIRDVYVKDLMTAQLALASTSTGGTKGSGTSWGPSLSADGSAVAFFSQANNLHPGDDDTFPDVYVKDLAAGTLLLGATTSGGTKSNGFTSFPSLSSDGAKVAFQTDAVNLNAADIDGFLDVYVKELGGDAPPPVTVSLKIKKAGAIYNVTVATTPAFNATTIDATTVCFGDAQAPAERDCTEVDGVGQLKDTDRDGDIDMLLQFEAAQTGIDLTDIQACLTGMTAGGTPIEGCGAVKPGRGP